MDLVFHQDSLKWDWWLKLVLVFSVVLILALGVLFFIDGYYHDVVPSEPDGESRLGGIILLASTVFMLALYWAVLPRRLYILQDRVRIKFGAFSLNYPFDSIESARTAKGIVATTGVNAVTSFGNQVEIVRKGGGSVRMSPVQRDLFLENLTRALRDWQRSHDE